MTCPLCGAALTYDAVVKNLVICPSCLRTISLADGDPRAAVGAETVVLSPDELGTLRQARKTARAAR